VEELYERETPLIGQMLEDIDREGLALTSAEEVTGERTCSRHASDEEYLMLLCPPPPTTPRTHTPTHTWNAPAWGDVRGH